MLNKCLKSTVLTLLFVTQSTGSVAATSSGTLTALIPWEGEGRVFRIAPETLMFLGAIEGIMYVRTREGKLDEGFVRCPITQQLNLKDQTTTARGYCRIIASGQDDVYAEVTCDGRVGLCEGTFTLTGGSGRFEGVTGSSKLLLRSPMRALIKDIASGNVVRVGSGIAILEKLEYKLATE